MDEVLRQRFSEILQEILKREGKTQADLARYIGVSSATASDWCNGFKIPRADKLQSIAKYLGVTVAILLGEKELGDEPLLSGEEIQIALAYRDLPTERKEVIRLILGIDRK